MGLPHHMHSGDSGSSGPGHGPFGEKAFKIALRACVALIVIGAVMAALGGGAVRGAGLALIVVCGVGLLTVGAGLLAERLLKRTPPPPPEVRGSNGHSRRYSHPPDKTRRR